MSGVVEFIDDETAVTDARTWAEALVDKCHRGCGGTVEDAMRQAETRFGIAYQLLWSLRYRPPKQLAVGAWSRVAAAYNHFVASQEAKLRHDIEITRKLPPTPARLALVAEAEVTLASLQRVGGQADKAPRPVKLTGTDG